MLTNAIASLTALFAIWTIAVITTAVSIGKNSIKTGRSIVFNPKAYPKSSNLG